MMVRIAKTLDDWLACTLMVIIVVVTIAAVFMRYILGDPLQWVEELVIALFIWVIMVGAVAAMKRRQHVSIDAFTAMLPVRAQALVAVFNDILSVVVLVVFGWLGLELAIEAGEKVTPILGISYSIIDSAVPLGMFWMALYLLIFLGRDLIGKQKKIFGNGDTRTQGEA